MHTYIPITDFDLLGRHRRSLPRVKLALNLNWIELYVYKYMYAQLHIILIQIFYFQSNDRRIMI